MRHRVKKNVSETGFENGGWLGPTKDHAKKKKKKDTGHLYDYSK